MRHSLIAAAGFAVLLQAGRPLSAAGFGPGTEPFLFVPPACAAAPFTDVPPSHPFCAWIDQAKDDGLSAGCGSGKYCPDAPVTRAQVALLLERAARGTASWSPWEGVFQQVKIVSPVLGDALASGQRLLGALGALTDGSTSRRYLVWLEPGQYDLGSAQLVMQPYVVVQGAGRSLVTIKTSRGGYGAVGASQAQLRSLTFRNSGDFSGVHGIDLSSSGGLRDVSVVVNGGATTTAVAGVLAGGFLEDVSVVATGGDLTIGVDVDDGYVTLNRIYASAQGGANAYGIRIVSTAGDVVIEHSQANSGLSTARSWGIYVATLGAGRTVLLRDVTTDAIGKAGDSPLVAGLYVLDGKVVVEDSRLEASPSSNAAWALACQAAASGARVEVHDSRLIGPDATVHATDADCTVLVGGSQLKGGAVDDGGLGTVTCVALYGDGFSSPGINSCF
jgi:hypothetical protein